MYFKKIDIIVESWTCSTFIQFFLLLSLISQSRVRFEHAFKDASKVEMLQ